MNGSSARTKCWSHCNEPADWWHCTLKSHERPSHSLLKKMPVYFLHAAASLCGRLHLQMRPFVNVQQMCASLRCIIHVSYVHECVCVCMCLSLSVWPFKRFLQGRGGREDNGSRHYLLLSCRLNIRPHTVWPSPTRTPSRCTCAHAPARRVHAAGNTANAHAHVRLCRDDARARAQRSLPG